MQPQYHPELSTFPGLRPSPLMAGSQGIISPTLVPYPRVLCKASSSAGALTLTDLEEDVLYQFTLRALTSAGEGEGRTVSAITEEDSECLVNACLRACTFTVYS